MGEAKEQRTSDGFESTLSVDGAQAREDSVPAGTMISARYLVEGLLGHGGMGNVYQVRDTELDRQIALKTLRHAPSGELSRRFRREVQLALRITHPNVVRLFDLGTWMGASFLTMELIEGGSLRNQLAAGPLSVARACEIARQVAAGLEAAHVAGVIHRDLKPENILLDEDRVVVVDFGVAGESVGQQQASAIVGTSSYMSPEQANGAPSNHRADLYALGLVLHEMLVGEVPLTGKGPVATALRREREAPPSARSRREDVPPALDQLIKQLLDRDPERRPATAAAVERQLAAWASPLSDEDPATIDIRPPQRERPRRWKLAALAITLATLAALAGALLLWPRGEPAAVATTSTHLFAAPARVEAELAADLEFLRGDLPNAVFRALAGQLPGRIATPRSQTRAPTVAAFITANPRDFTVRLEVSGKSFAASDRNLPAALDRAAGDLVAELAASPPASAEERALQARWNAPSIAAVRATRRAEIALARMHYGGKDADPGALLDRAGPGFVRPYTISIWSLSTLGGDRQALAEKALRDAATAPASERLLLQSWLAVADDEISPADQLDADSTEPWTVLARAWMLAYQGKVIDAVAMAQQVGRDPEVGGLGRQVANKIASYYSSPGRARAAARVNADSTAEEPVAWFLLAEAALGESGDLATTELAIARARALGADERPLYPLEAALAFRKHELAAATSLAMRMLGDDAEESLTGLRVLYAVETLQGHSGATTLADRLIELSATAPSQKINSALISLAIDGYVGGNRRAGRKFAAAAVGVARKLKDNEYEAIANSLLLAADHRDGKLDRAAFTAGLDDLASFLRGYGHDPGTLSALPLARFLAIAPSDCEPLIPAAQALPLGAYRAVALARCELATGDAARAVATLEKLTGATLGVNFPNLMVERELLLGKALTALGKRERARIHLERVVDFRRHALDRRFVDEAQALLID